MKNFVQFFLLVIFVSCNKEKPCIDPVCAPPNINRVAIFQIKFCQNPEDALCFSVQELNEIIFTTRVISTSEIIESVTIENIVETDYTITIGGNTGVYDFGPEPSGINVLQDVQYFYEIEIPAIERSYKIDNFQFAGNTEPCSCPEYDFQSVQVNDKLYTLDEPGNVCILKK